MELAVEYPHIDYAVVLDRLPGPRNKFDIRDYTDAIFPEELETAPPRLAIARRNKWMLMRSDFVVTYIAHSWGSAAQFAEKAARLGKTVINLAEKYPVGDNA